MRIALLALVLAACAQPVKLEVVEVKVPIMVACSVSPPAPPVWATSTLPPTADIFQIVRALWAEIEQRTGYEQVLRASFATCTQQRSTP